MLYYSDLTTKHLATDAKEDKDDKDLSRADVVLHKSPLLPVRDAAPVTENQLPLGTDLFAFVNHTHLFM